MIVKFGSIITAGRGKIGGVVYSRARGGATARAFTAPINPRTTAQDLARGTLAYVAAAWLALTGSSRELWMDRAATLTYKNKLGEGFTPTGQNAFVRANALRRLAGLALVDSPAAETTDVNTAATVATVDTDGNVSVTFDAGEDWDAVGGALLLFVSRPQSPGRSVPKGGYQYAGKKLGAATPITSPQEFSNPFIGALENQRVFYRLVALAPDGRQSAYVEGVIDVTPAV